MVSVVIKAVSIMGPLAILGPQIRRVISIKTTEGIDFRALRMGLTATLGWAVYGVANNLWLHTVANILGFALLAYLAKLFTNLNSDVQMRSFGLFLLPYSLVLLFLANQSRISIGLVCFLVSAIGPMRQVVRALRDLNLLGLSAMTYVNGITIHASWIIYGFEHNDLFTILPNFYGLTIASLLLFRIVQSRLAKVTTTQNLIS
jgi:uncharacterized protein with PQ loop repeat